MRNLLYQISSEWAQYIVLCLSIYLLLRRKVKHDGLLVSFFFTKSLIALGYVNGFIDESIVQTHYIFLCYLLLWSNSKASKGNYRVLSGSLIYILLLFELKNKIEIVLGSNLFWLQLIPTTLVGFVLLRHWRPNTASILLDSMVDIFLWFVNSLLKNVFDIYLLWDKINFKNSFVFKFFFRYLLKIFEFNIINE